MVNEDKTRYSDQELLDFRTIIEDKLDKAREHFEFYKNQLKELTSGPDGHIKGLDDGISTSENERMMQMAARAKKYIHHLENALIRVKNKTFGICRITGKLISKERLKAVPHATLSMEAKQQRMKRPF